MKFFELSIPGCYLIQPKIFVDDRGRLVKTWHQDIFKQHQLSLVFREEYHSTSNRGVLRGLHFQKPPHDYYKLVYCIAGEILDALIDIRKDSPTYGKSEFINLAAEQSNMVLMPPGIAHGFYTLSDKATIVCKTSEVYSPDNDDGIHWQSIEGWPDANPIMSEKDRGLPLLENHVSPFFYKKSHGSVELI